MEDGGGFGEGGFELLEKAFGGWWGLGAGGWRHSGIFETKGRYVADKNFQDGRQPIITRSLRCTRQIIDDHGELDLAQIWGRDWTSARSASPVVASRGSCPFYCFMLPNSN